MCLVFEGCFGSKNGLRDHLTPGCPTLGHLIWMIYGQLTVRSSRQRGVTESSILVSLWRVDNSGT